MSRPDIIDDIIENETDINSDWYFFKRGKKRFNAGHPRKSIKSLSIFYFRWWLYGRNILPVSQNIV